MSELKGALRVGEKLVLRVRLHWVIFLQPTLWLLAGLSLRLGLAAALLGLLPAGESSVGEDIDTFWAEFGFDAYAMAGRFALAMGAVGLLLAAVRWRYTELLVTSERVLWRYGLLGQTEFGVSLEAAAAAMLQRGVAGALFGYGALKLGGRMLTPVPARRSLPVWLASTGGAGTTS